jgi:endonuclease YncB( thermonuclease family)
MRLLFTILSFWMLAYTLNAETVAGRVTVIDGDTLEMHGQRIRLHGIDAPESGQSCADKKGATYRCGQISANQMASYVRGKTVNCNVTDRDRYGRLVAACYVNGENINERLVFEGWALAYRQYSRDYVRAETQAKRNSSGMWQGRFVEPWKWRKGSRLASTKQDKSGDCAIKGNISSSGKIYHTPESPWYSQTKINPQKGERWFCSEAEAEAAGWRAPRR